MSVRRLSLLMEFSDPVFHIMCTFVLHFEQNIGDQLVLSSICLNIRKTFKDTIVFNRVSLHTGYYICDDP